MRVAYVLLSLTTLTFGAITVHIDMDPEVEGIQVSRVVASGDSFDVEVLVETDAMGVAAYGLSVRYDPTELRFVSAEETPVAPLMSLAPGVLDQESGDGLMQVSSFDGVTFGIGPVETTFAVGTLTFTVLVPLDDEAADIVPGFFAISDGIFDNTVPLGLDLRSDAILKTGGVLPLMTAAPQLPTNLSIHREGNTVVVRWTDPDNLTVLQSSSNMRTDSWATVELDIVVDEGDNVVTFSIETAQFFRLAAL